MRSPRQVALPAAAGSTQLPVAQLLCTPFLHAKSAKPAWFTSPADVQELRRRGGPLPLKLYASANRSPLLAGQCLGLVPIRGPGSGCPTWQGSPSDAGFSLRVLRPAGPEHDVDPTVMHLLPPESFWEALAARYGPNPSLVSAEGSWRPRGWQMLSDNTRVVWLEGHSCSLICVCCSCRSTLAYASCCCRCSQPTSV